MCLNPKLLIPEWVFTKGTREGRIFIHYYDVSADGCIVENVFLYNIFLSGRNDKCLGKCFQVVYSTGQYDSISIHSRFLIIVSKLLTTNIKRTIHYSKANVRVITKHKKVGSSFYELYLSCLDTQFTIQYESVGPGEHFHSP